MIFNSCISLSNRCQKRFFKLINTQKPQLIFEYFCHQSTPILQLLSPVDNSNRTKVLQQYLNGEPRKQITLRIQVNFVFPWSFSYFSSASTTLTTTAQILKIVLPRGCFFWSSLVCKINSRQHKIQDNSDFEFIPSSADMHRKRETWKGKNTIGKRFPSHKKEFHIGREGSKHGFPSKKHVILLSGARARGPWTYASKGKR